MIDEEKCESKGIFFTKIKIIRGRSWMYDRTILDRAVLSNLQIFIKIWIQSTFRVFSLVPIETLSVL